MSQFNQKRDLKIQQLMTLKSDNAFISGELKNQLLDLAINLLISFPGLELQKDYGNDDELIKSVEKIVGDTY